jgi:hypothetical protein
MPKLLLFILLFSVGAVQAQFRSGYLIMADGTIKNGSIEREYNFFNGCTVKFKDSRGKIKKYKPQKINGFTVDDTTFISLSNLNFQQPLRRSIIIKTDFVKVLHDDEIALYEHEYKNDQVWLATPLKTHYLIKNQVGIVHLPSDLRELQVKLADMFKSFEDLSLAIIQNDINPAKVRSELIRYVKAYNEWLKENR